MSVELEQFKETYLTECYELLEDMEERLLNLEEGEPDIDELNAIFRCAHSIKGGAGAFKFTRLVSFTHVLEALLDAMRENKVPVTKDGVDALLKSVDIVTQIVNAARDGEEIADDFGLELQQELEKLAGGEIELAEGAASEQERCQESDELQLYDISFKPHPELFSSGNDPLLIIRELKSLGDATVNINLDDIPDYKKFDPEKCYLSWQIELTTNKGMDAVKEAFEFVEDNCDLEIGEFGGLNLSPPTQQVESEDAPKPRQEEGDKPEGPKKASSAPAVTSVRVDLEKIDRLVNMVGEMVITQAMIVMQTRDLPPERFTNLIQGVNELSQHTRELQEAVMSVRMQPVKSVFSRLPRIVRDLSTKLGKNIVIEMSGETTEIDKTVIEQLSDPLTHMIRNSVDHGIELPADRKAAGKNEQGTIKLSASHSGGRIIIEVSDDGGGINRDRVLQKAKDKGVVSKEAVLSEEEIDNLIFNAGFSTAEEVTDVSGRGVGMDVVRQNIEALGGTIYLENNPGNGTRFVVSLPLTLAIMDGMIVRVGNEDYIIPINNIIECLRPQKDAVKKVADGSDVINVRGRFVPIIFLYEVFNINGAHKDASEALVVLVENGREQLGIVVDELIGQQQVVIKNIEENTETIDGVGGATILGDGNVSLILDIGKLQRLVGMGDHSEMREAQKQYA